MRVRHSPRAPTACILLALPTLAAGILACGGDEHAPSGGSVGGATAAGGTSGTGGSTNAGSTGRGGGTGGSRSSGFAGTSGMSATGGGAGRVAAGGGTANGGSIAASGSAGAQGGSAGNGGSAAGGGAAGKVGGSAGASGSSAGSGGAVSAGAAGAATGGDGGTGGAAGAPATVDSVWAARAQAFCEAMAGCCVGIGQQVEGDCVAATLAQAPESGALAIDDAKATACIAEIPANACAEGNAVFFRESCRGAILGTLGQGASCKTDYECAKDGVCSPGESLGSVCRARGIEGSPCALTVYADFQYGRFGYGFFAPKDSQLYCAGEDGLSCSGDGFCGKPVALGASCATLPCASNLVCFKNTCEEYAALGEQCDLDDQCGSGAICKAKQCVLDPLPKRGEPCKASRCDLGLICENVSGKLVCATPLEAAFCR